MSTSIGQYGQVGSALILAAGIKQMAESQETLSWETSAGTLSETYAGLGSSRSSALSLTPKITQIESYQSNVSSAQSSLTITASALSQIVSMAQTLDSNILSISGTTTSTAVTGVADEAQTALTDLATTLNTSDGTGYVFAGQASTAPPIKDTSTISSGTLATEISSIVSSLSTSGATSVMEQATAAAGNNTSSVSVFSSNLSVTGTDATSLQKSVLTGSDSATELGVVATQGTDSSSTSTGSPIRDLMRDMMIASSLSGMSSSTSGYSDLVSQLHSSLQTTISQITNMETSVGVTQDALTTRSTLLTNMKSMLTTQLGDSRDADLATVATQTSALNTRLQASYTLISDMKNMSLASYL